MGLEEPVELAGHVADQAASDFAVGLALSPSPLGIGAGGWVIAQPGQHDQVQGLVELAIAGAIQPHPYRLAAGSRDGRSAAEHGDKDARAAGSSVGKSAWAKALTYFNGTAT